MEAFNKEYFGNQEVLNLFNNGTISGNRPGYTGP